MTTNVFGSITAALGQLVGITRSQPTKNAPPARRVARRPCRDYRTALATGRVSVGH